MDAFDFHACTFKIKKPADCSLEEIIIFRELIEKACAKPTRKVLVKILKCELLGFCYFEGTVIAVSAIKKALPAQLKKVFAHAKLLRSLSDAYYEPGFCYTEPEFRLKGIALELKRKLIREMELKSGILFITTCNTNFQPFLLENGFLLTGFGWYNEEGIPVFYFEKLLRLFIFQ